MAKKNNVYIGTSGWHYQHWKGPFYPEDLPDKKMLEFYSERLQTVEINNSFYQVPDEKTIKQWSRTAGPNFIFSIKASHYITHMKKLKDSRKPLKNFMDKITVLGNSLGPILFQLPPNWGKNVARLQSFLEALPAEQRFAIEFRNEDWFGEDINRLLEKYNVAFCIYDFNSRQSPKEVTADFVYIRLHGPEEKYRGKYDSSALAGWAGAISGWTEKGKDVFCYFDNDQAGYAAENAMQLHEMVGGK